MTSTRKRKTSRKWTPEDDQVLRDGWGNKRSGILAKEIGRSPSSLKQRAAKLGLDCGRYYTDEDKKTLREMYQTHPASAIAQKLHGSPRSVGAVYRMAYKLGLRKWPSWDPKVIRRVRELHGRGLIDTEIAARMKMTRNQVHAIRYERLKLPNNFTTAKKLECGRRAVVSQLRSLGLKRPCDLRCVAHRKFAEECGWPGDLRIRAVQILNALAEYGPQDAKTLARLIGLPKKSQLHRIPLRANGRSAGRSGLAGTYTAELMHIGFVAYQHRSVHTGRRGIGRIGGLYILTPKVMEYRKKALELRRSAQ